MKAKRLLKLLVPAIAVTMGVSSCQDYDADFTEKSIQYTDAFKKAFGEIDPNQDWSAATQVKANIDLTGVNGSCVVTVYNCAPTNNNSAILYRSDAIGGGNFEVKFDVPKTNKDLYVMVRDEKGLTPISNYFVVSDNVLTVTQHSKSTRAGHEVSLGDPVSSDRMGTFRDEKGLWGSAETPGLWDSSTNCAVKYTDLFTMYHLNGIGEEWGASWRISDIDPITGKTFSDYSGTVSRYGVFNERGEVDASGRCGLAKWYNELDAEKGAEYILEEKGPVEFDVMYGGTDNDNMFGYLYYQDGATWDEVIRRPHYILMESAMMKDNIKIGGSNATGGMAITSLVEDYDRALFAYESDKSDYNKTNLDNANKTLTGRHYRLTWFGESGADNSQASYDFPSNTHIVFFLIHTGISKESGLGAEIEYSIPELNKRENKIWTEGHSKASEYYDVANISGKVGELDAVTYRWGGQIVLGFEDRGGDDDMNDILFFIKGKFKNTNEIKDLKENKEDVYEWMVACEDLGGTDDYDFNDVVFGVKKYDSKTTLFKQFYENGVLVSTTPAQVSSDHYLMVTPYAAGGTLKTNIKNGTYFAGHEFAETHTLITGNNYSEVASGSMPVLNAYSKGTPGTPVVISLTETEADEFSINEAGFSIQVTEKDGSTQTVSQPNTKYNKESGIAPQMLILPQGWTWPKERNIITLGYPDFENWVKDVSHDDWYKNSNASNLVAAPTIHEYVPGGNGSGTNIPQDPELSSCALELNTETLTSLTSINATTTISYSEEGGGAVTAYSYPANDAVQVSVNENTITVTAVKAFSGDITIKVEQAASLTHNAGSQEFTVSLDIVKADFPSGEQELSLAKIEDWSQLSDALLTAYWNASNSVYYVDLSTYKVPSNMKGNYTVTMNGSGSYIKIFTNNTTLKFEGSSEYGTVHKGTISSAIITDLFANGGFYVCSSNGGNGISSFKITLVDE